uniref:ADAMTS/ADAMTS-like cysteine-rich domain-containing protein n=1 Tax=Spermophilus dauricus TaxID=99837 RepID=A0A8C9URY4_SPEDA
RVCCRLRPSPPTSLLLIQWHCILQVVVDGGWSAWGPWGECSRTCGGGVQFSHRECKDPEPQNGGRYCLGRRSKYQSCHTEECPYDGKSFREQQCEKYNAYNYTDIDGNLLQWVPKYSGVSPRDRCKLFCRARGRSEFKVIDGTLCGPETLAICIRGQCVKAGCDHVVDSPRKLDKCGVCGGKGNSCRKVSGSFTPSSHLSESHCKDCDGMSGALGTGSSHRKDGTQGSCFFVFCFFLEGGHLDTMYQL